MQGHDSHTEGPKPADGQDDSKSEHDQNVDAHMDEDKDLTDRFGSQTVTEDIDRRPKQFADVIYYEMPMYFW